jgi:hypothetical protein
LTNKENSGEVADAAGERPVKHDKWRNLSQKDSAEDNGGEASSSSSSEMGESSESEEGVNLACEICAVSSKDHFVAPS